MSRFENLLECAAQDGIVPGAVVFAKDKTGKINYSKAVTGKDQCYHEDTVLEIASLTKLVTAIAALQLVEKGLVTLGEDVSSFIPAFTSQEVLDGFDEQGKPKTQKRRNTVTLRLLLTHSAGAGYPFTDTRLVQYATSTNQPEKRNGTVDSNFDFPLSYEPNEGFMYSSSMDRVGQIVEGISGMPLEDYFSRNIWQPLGINTGTFWDTNHPPMAIRLAPGEPAKPMSGMDTFTTGWTECSGGQGLYMSMKDYIKILYSLLKDDEKLLKKETASNIFKPCLSPASKAVLLKRMQTPTWLVGDFPETGEYDWSLGGLLVDGDKHDYRKRNTVMWSGASGCFWFIDRDAGVCGVFGTQVLPPADPQVQPLIKAFEEEVYRQLGSCKD
ncbi:beta-lactamase [Ilyonectria robusta]